MNRLRLTHCDACAALISQEYESYSAVTIQYPDGTREKFILCDDCSMNLEERIRNGEMTPVGD